MSRRRNDLNGRGWARCFELDLNLETEEYCLELVFLFLSILYPHEQIKMLNKYIIIFSAVFARYDVLTCKDVYGSHNPSHEYVRDFEKSFASLRSVDTCYTKHKLSGSLH